MKKCLITGATGLIGSQLLEYLNQNWSIVALSRNSIPSYPTVKTIDIDLSKPWSRDILPEKIDAVIHLAQSEHFREFPQKSEHIFQVNTSTTLQLIDRAIQANAKVFVLASTGGVYGFGDEPFGEDTSINSASNLGFYASTKLCSEILVNNYKSLIDIVILRFFFVYGRGQRKTMLIPRLVRSVLQEQPIILQGSDGIRVNPIHVSDAAKAIVRSLSLKGSYTINIAGSEILSLRQIGETIATTVKKEPIFEVQMDKTPQNILGDNSRMKKLLHDPEINFLEGIKDVVRSETN
ncbi:NAD(P)-dependent oxidoreductase [Pannus brasiliensis CCIBt3594]|uniref:NAD(P)-dependent oxidoreductase n=1 Tax=Pannus brasiliensis CCIBt3594 TaxID=1427578 RepID=A0AAW9QM39_9CHRO